MESNGFDNVPEEFRSSVGKPKIRFCMAAYDPEGNPHNGIIRHNTLSAQIGLTNDIFYTDRGGSNAWDTERYLNVWVANTGDFVSGLGTYPWDSTAERTGIIVHPKYFGINNHPPLADSVQLKCRIIHS